MKRLTIIAFLGFASLANAQNRLQVVEGGLELSLSDIVFPNSAAGTMIVQECEACERRSLRVDADTIYRLPTGDVSLEEALAVVAELRTTESGRETYVSVFYSLENGRITRVSIHPDES